MAKLPTIVSSIPRDLRMFLDRVREALSANGDDALVTLKSLETYGLVQRQGNMVTALAQNGDFATPPAPLNLTADGALASIILSWGTPQYRGHAYTEIWAAQEPTGGGVPDLGEAVLVGMSPGTAFSHNLGAGTTRWYWVRFVNVADEAGPYNAVDGVEASTGQDPAYLLELLTGQLTESQLYQTLGERIDLIDAGASVTGSVAARIADEAQTRASADGELQAQYTVKVESNGYVAGFGLASTAIDAVPTSEFIVRSDKFAIASPSGPGVAPAEPFFVRTTATTINGVSVPAGVYINEAFIQNGTIANAKIGDAAIDDAKIANLSAAKITAGTLDANRIGANTITGDKISTDLLAAKLAQITDAYVGTANIDNGAITNAKIKDADINIAKIDTASINDLSSLSANIGTITAGKMQSSDGKFVIDLNNKLITITV